MTDIAAISIQTNGWDATRDARNRAYGNQLVQVAVARFGADGGLQETCFETVAGPALGAETLAALSTTAAAITAGVGAEKAMLDAFELCRDAQVVAYGAHFVREVIKLFWQGRYGMVIVHRDDGPDVPDVGEVSCVMEACRKTLGEQERLMKMADACGAFGVAPSESLPFPVALAKAMTAGRLYLTTTHAGLGARLAGGRGLPMGGGI